MMVKSESRYLRIKREWYWDEEDEERLKEFEKECSRFYEDGKMPEALRILKKWRKMENDGMTVDDLSEKDYITLVHSYKGMWN